MSTVGSPVTDGRRRRGRGVNVCPAQCNIYRVALSTVGLCLACHNAHPRLGYRQMLSNRRPKAILHTQGMLFQEINSAFGASEQGVCQIAHARQLQSAGACAKLGFVHPEERNLP